MALYAGTGVVGVVCAMDIDSAAREGSVATAAVLVASAVDAPGEEGAAAEDPAVEGKAEEGAADDAGAEDARAWLAEEGAAAAEEGARLALTLVVTTALALDIETAADKLALPGCAISAKRDERGWEG
jgi:hypothetical protein